MEAGQVDQNVRSEQAHDQRHRQGPEPVDSGPEEQHPQVELVGERVEHQHKKVQPILCDAERLVQVESGARTKSLPASAPFLLAENEGREKNQDERLESPEERLVKPTDFCSQDNLNRLEKMACLSAE